MKFLCISFYILFVVLLPLSTYAELTGYVVYKHPYNYDEIWITNIRDTRNARLLFKHNNYDEIWITNIRDTRNARLLFKHNNVIQDLSVQKNSRYIAIVSTDDPSKFTANIYLVDTVQGHATLVQDIIRDIVYIDISHNGDIVFTTSLFIEKMPRHDGAILKEGVYLVRSDEIGKHNANITLLREGHGSSRVDWAPNGKQIAHGSSTGLFILDVATKNNTRISRKGANLAFSPDGKKIAFSYVDATTNNRQIDIISLDTLQPLMTIKDLIVHTGLGDIRWSPDGTYLIYTAYVARFFEAQVSHHNIAIPVNGGHPERILDIGNRGISQFDWIDTAYPVEPENHLTTLWGEIKQ